jgi:hypothetical protein
MRKLWLSILLAILSFAQVNDLMAQSKGDFGYTTINARVGIANYFGDLNPLAQYMSTELSFTRPSFGLEVERIFRGQRFGIRFGLMWARLQGDDFTAADPNNERHRYRYIRNAHFRNDVFETTLVGTIRIPEIAGGTWRNPVTPWTPYVFIGIGALYHNPVARTPEEFGGNWVSLKPLQTEGQDYSSFAFMIPFGVGVDWRLTDRIDIGVEMGMRFTFTDYLDDVSGLYTDPANLSSDLARAMANRTMEPVSALKGGSRQAEIQRLGGLIGTSVFIGPDGRPYTSFNGFGQEGDQRGNDGATDVYLVTSVHLKYVLGARPFCPDLGSRKRNRRGGRLR